jgi:tight adherence protein B
MFEDIDPVYIFYAALVGAILAVAETIYLLAFPAAAYRKNVNRRLAEYDGASSRQEAVQKLRRERGIAGLEEKLKIANWLDRLITQSGVTLGFFKLGAMAVTAAIIAFIGALLRYNLAVAVGAAIFAGLILPLLTLLYLRKRRRAKFTEQFPEALDIIVRSLRAGHPVPAAIRMAARELPDPCGTEFGMAEDEITFGLDIETAMRNMMERVGQEDLPLFITSVSIVSGSGGNLTEILQNLTEVIRLRIKMRRKIRALSAEGRISALILSAVPIFLFFIINWLTPGFYGSNWGHPWIVWGLSGAGVWMLIGNAVMHKMINFRM